jgi:hypothetical protein
MTANDKLPAPPYVAFRTFVNFLDWLGDVGVPNRIDRSFWGQRLSGGYGAQLMAALRFFDLISEEDVPNPGLEDLATNAEQRKVILRNLLEARYREALAELDLDRATAGQLAERFRRFSISGETLRKAIMFFVHAAQYCGIPLSPHITRPGSVVKATSGRAGQGRAPGPRARLEGGAGLPVSVRPPATVERPALHPAVEALLRDLNERGSGWTGDERKRWIDTFLAVMEYAYPAAPTS